MKFNFKIIDWEALKNGYLQHKNLLSSSNIQIQEIANEIAEVSTKEDEFNNWHLAEFGRFYGATIFRNNYELLLVDSQKCDIQFNKPIESQTIIIENKWNKSIEFKTFYLNCAEAYRTNLLANSLSELGVETLNSNYSELRLEKGSFKNSNSYAYQIIKEILFIISYNRTTNRCIIENLYKTEWHEK